MTSRSRLAAIAAAVLLVAAATLTGCNTDAGIAAKVNGRPIKTEDVTKQLDQMKKASPQSFQTTDAPAIELEYKAKILENLIQVELINETAEKLGVKVEQKQIDDYLKQLETQYGGKTGLQDAMKQSGIDEAQLKKAVSSRLLVDAVRLKVTKDPGITDKQAREYYDKNAALFATQAQVHAAHILLPDADKALAEQLLDQVKKGGDFAALAKKNSTDPGTKDNGGDLGWASPGGYVAEFSKAVVEMKPGEFRLVHTQFGYHVIKLLETKPVSQKTFDEVKAQIIDMLGQQARSDEFTKYVDDLRKKAKVEILDADLKKATEAAAPASKPSTPTP